MTVTYSMNPMPILIRFAKYLLVPLWIAMVIALCLLFFLVETFNGMALRVQLLLCCAWIAWIKPKLKRDSNAL